VVLADSREEMFREFVAARSPALLRLAYLVCGDHGLAEDLLQTTLARTYLAWRRLDGIESLEAYSRRVLVNTATSWWRRRWRGERPTGDLPERPVGDHSHQVVERDAIWQLLDTLPARQRAVIVLRYYEDLSEAEIAVQLGMAPGTVKSYASRALATLRTQLGSAATPAPRPAPLRSSTPLCGPTAEEA
jgi:RNA polymerase sigma-70 factor (ECF subfamily)